METGSANSRRDNSEGGGNKGARRNSPGVNAIIEFCKVLKICIKATTDSLKTRTRKDVTSRYSLFINYIDNYLNLLNSSKNKLSTVHYPWFLKLYDRFYNDIPTITDKDKHGDDEKDMMRSKEMYIWIGEKERNESLADKNYRLPIWSVYKLASDRARNYLKRYNSSEDIDPELQLDCLRPWEIKYYFMEIICLAVADKNPEDEDLEELKAITYQLKVNANLTEEQAKENAKKTVKGLARGVGGFIQSLGLKDQEGNPISGSFDSAESAMGMVAEMFTGGDVIEAINSSFNTDDATPESMFDKIMPVIKKTMVKIPRPPGVEGDEEMERQDDIADKLMNGETGDKVKKGLVMISEAFTGITGDGK
jgi:hypothetical protein